MDADTRQRFANDVDDSQLIAVSAASNRSKGAKSPDQWVSSNKDYWCTYSEAWAHIKYAFGLSVTQAEKDGEAEMLGTCD